MKSLIHLQQQARKQIVTCSLFQLVKTNENYRRAVLVLQFHIRFCLHCLHEVCNMNKAHFYIF